MPEGQGICNFKQGGQRGPLSKALKKVARNFVHSRVSESAGAVVTESHRLAP